ncbi:alpha/beta fold hydrolase [bacterium]|nr:alpha/beta fold hydrolase [bacterium]
MKKILLALALCSGPFCYIGYLHQNQENLIFDIRKLHKDYKFEFSIPFEELTIKGADLVTPLSAIHFKTPHTRKGVVFFLHGSGTNISEIPSSLPEKVIEKGYDFFTYDYRGFGKSGGKITEQDLLEDSKVIYKRLVNQYGEKNVILYGRSLGTSLATFIASQNTPKHLVLEAPFYSMLDMAQNEYPFLPKTAVESILSFHLRSDLWISDVQIPITFAHGDQDDWVPLTEANRLFEKAQAQKKEFNLFKEWGHDHFCDHPEYDNLLDRILT